MLKLTLGHLFTQKKCNKRDSIRIGGPGSLKIVLILLTEIITVYIRVTKVQFREMGFEKLFLRTSVLIRSS